MSKTRPLTNSAIAGAALLAMLTCEAKAGVWPEMGDAQLRSDIELAVAAGVLDNITTQGPQPWTAMLGDLGRHEHSGDLPAQVRGAVERLSERGVDDLRLHKARLSISVDVASDPTDVRAYDALGYSQAQAQIAYDYLATSTAVHLSVGARKASNSDKQTFVLDGTYIAQRLDDVVVYAGWVPHWWGPGWISGLTLSTNARPMPQVGFSRTTSQASDWWLLNWLGPWQFDGFVGLLDGPRDARNTAYIALHFAFNPLPGFEIGLSRTTQMCGSGHPCQPLVEYFTFSNDDEHINQTNEEASVDLRYTSTLSNVPYAVYAQFMNEDTNPVIHSGSSRVYGGTVWLPVEGVAARLTLEYANSIATKDIWGGGMLHGFSYNNYSYKDGMRYRGRTLGFSLDSDSVLYSAQAAAVDESGRTYTLTYHRALVSHPLNTWGNVVSTEPVRFNVVELRTRLPVDLDPLKTRVEIAARWQSDQPRPERGSQLALEVALRCGI
jgi:hypothetical protein